MLAEQRLTPATAAASPSSTVRTWDWSAAPCKGGRDHICQIIRSTHRPAPSGGGSIGTHRVLRARRAVLGRRRRIRRRRRLPEPTARPGRADFPSDFRSSAARSLARCSVGREGGYVRNTAATSASTPGSSDCTSGSSASTPATSASTPGSSDCTLDSSASRPATSASTPARWARRPARWASRPATSASTPATWGCSSGTRASTPGSSGSSSAAPARSPRRPAAPPARTGSRAPA